MLNEFQSIEALIDDMKGTTGFISGLLSGISGLAVLFVVLGVIVSQFIIK